MRRWVMAAGMMLALAGCMRAVSGHTGLPTTFFGAWEGRGSQPDPPGEWTITARIMGGQPVGGLVGTIAYPSLGCTGTLTLIAASSTGLELGERITTGPCEDGGIITLTPLQDGRLRYAWRKESIPGATAEGMLARARS